MMEIYCSSFSLGVQLVIKIYIIPIETASGFAKH